MEFLYGIGFEYIGQIQSGNVFVIDGRCVLGGYENTLLGFWTSSYAALQEEGLLDKMDIIMFGEWIRIM